MIRIELTDDIRLVYDTARYLAELAPSFGMDKARRNALCFVIETILADRLSQLGDASGSLVVEMSEQKAGLKISFTDKGVPYIPSATNRLVFHNSRLGRLSFEQLGIDGQRLTVHVRQTSGYAAPLPAERPEEQLQDTSVACHLTTTEPSDIIEAIRCLYEVYGYGYLHQGLYQSEQFEQMLESGKYVSVLATNAHGQVLGHAALEEHEGFPGLREVCNLVIKPLARGLGLSKVIVSFLVDMALREKTGNLYALPVLHHPISQKLMNTAGLVPCGLLANIMDMSHIQGHEDDQGRVSCAICVRNVVETNERVLYLPEECASFVRAVLDEADMTYVDGRVRAAEDDEAPRETVFSYTIDAVHSFVETRVDVIGPDAYEQFERDYRQRQGDQFKALVIYLNACDPQCPALYASLRESGFLFVGCMPGGTNGDYLLLERLTDCTFNRAGIVAEPNYARMLDELYHINGL